MPTSMRPDRPAHPPVCQDRGPGRLLWRARPDHLDPEALNGSEGYRRGIGNHDVDLHPVILQGGQVVCDVVTGGFGALGPEVRHVDPARRHLATAPFVISGTARAARTLV